ncbi:DUF3793 family protein [Thermotalea metallivorans]|uniref:DUF3793 domain-containing protein n=1 Tax=Thermotalea metallivorans TaxID=520762 RepID=A0A140L7Y9_9FIRM|nr:DUF3793 family protein [Thermotalea metallivorans]KXG76664.1 hypothetical protein AN619_08830 [Thermotalea metallivorans]
MTAMCKNASCCMDSPDEFIKWLMEILGPVLFHVKPSELLSFPLCDANTHAKLHKIEEIFNKCQKIAYEIFEYNKKSVKVMFYNPMLMDAVLKDHRNLKFLVQRGYPERYNLELYLDCLIQKMKEGNIPDEIGVFLGYPLKDVIGFIGHPSLKLTKVRGWRIYGNSRLSDLRYKEFVNAKSKMKTLLDHYSPQTIILTA